MQRAPFICRECSTRLIGRQNSASCVGTDVDEFVQTMLGIGDNRVRVELMENGGVFLLSTQMDRDRSMNGQNFWIRAVQAQGNQLHDFEREKECR